MNSKRLIFLALPFFLLHIALGQNGKTISYGSNTKAGHFYHIRGIKLYCEVYGAGKPLLMIHGNGGSIRNFEKNIGFFAKNGFKVIAADSRAQGKSKDESDSLSFEMMADDFSLLLDSLRIRSAYVIGWSDGGINALLLAIRHPSKVKKLAVSGANLWVDSSSIDGEVLRRDNLTYSLLRTKLISSFTEKNRKKLFMLDWQQPNIPVSDLQKIKSPALVIAGDRDVITVSHTTLIYQHLPHAYLWILPGSGHRTFSEHSELFNKTVENFFDDRYSRR